MGKLDEMDKRFAENLKTLRAIRGFSRKQLSKECGVSEVCIVNYEHYKSLPNVVDGFLLAKALGVTLDELVGKTIEVKMK